MFSTLMSFLNDLRGRLVVAFMCTLGFLNSNVFAQVGADDPEITVELPFDLAPIITAVLGLAVLVLILVSGPKISLQFAKKAIRAIGNIF